MEGTQNSKACRFTQHKNIEMHERKDQITLLR